MERILFLLGGLMLLGGSAVALHLMKRVKKLEEMVTAIGVATVALISDKVGEEDE